MEFGFSEEDEYVAEYGIRALGSKAYDHLQKKQKELQGKLSEKKKIKSDIKLSKKVIKALTKEGDLFESEVELDVLHKNEDALAIATAKIASLRSSISQYEKTLGLK